MFKVKNRNTKRRSGVFLVNFKHIWHVILLIFLDFEHVIVGWNTKKRELAGKELKTVQAYHQVPGKYF